jgi:hypothetical protein
MIHLHRRWISRHPYGTDKASHSSVEANMQHYRKRITSLLTRVMVPLEDAALPQAYNFPDERCDGF